MSSPEIPRHNEIPSMTSCTAASPGTMKGSVDDVEPLRRPTRRTDSADKTAPGGIPRHDDETSVVNTLMKLRTATTRSITKRDSADDVKPRDVRPATSCDTTKDSADVEHGDIPRHHERLCR